MTASGLLVRIVKGQTIVQHFRRLICVLFCFMAASVQAVEVRTDPYLLVTSLGPLLDGGDAARFELGLDMPATAGSSWGPDYRYSAGQAGTYHRLGVTWTGVAPGTSGLYWGAGAAWVQVVPQAGATLDDVCRPLVPVQTLGRWGYRWQFSELANLQLGIQVNAGQLAGRQAERCAEDGSEQDLGPAQNVVDPSLDLKLGIRL